jgi:uncharacterized protein DUF6265
MSVIRIITFYALAIVLLASGMSRASAAKQTAGAGPQSGLDLGAPSSVSPGPVPARKFVLAELAWLSGRWQGQWGPRVVEQVWTPAKADMMLGTYRVIENDKTLVVELLALAESPDGIEYRIRHFTPTLAPWEKAGSTVLNLVSMDIKRIVFENPVDGQPKHAILDRIDEDTYVSRSEIVPLEGNAQVVSITFRRQKPVLKKP